MVAIWNSITTYTAGTQVARAGSVWEALTDNTGLDPSLSSQWVLVLGVTGGILKDKLTLVSSDASKSSLSFGTPGIRPVARVNGDMWTEANGSLWMRQAGSDRQLLTAVPVGAYVSAAKVTNNVFQVFTGASSVIPNDNTPPLITEGGFVLALNFSAKSATNKIRVEANLSGLSNVKSSYITAAIFDGNNCMSAGQIRISNPYDTTSLIVETPDFVAGSTASRAFSLRVGQNSILGTIILNGSGTNWLGGVINTVLKVTEISS